MGKLPLIEVGDQLFLSDGAAAIGAVRTVAPGGRPELLVNVEGFGDAVVPLDVVEKVVAGKVVLRYDRLAPELQRAAKHIADREDFPPRDEGEVELVPASEEDEDEDARNVYDGPRVTSPPDELPGRDEGARYGAPPSVHAIRNRPGGK
jgi:hypothetical protein